MLVITVTSICNADKRVESQTEMSPYVLPLAYQKDFTPPGARSPFAQLLLARNLP